MSDLTSSLLLIGITALWGWTFMLIKQTVLPAGDPCPVLPFLATRFLIGEAPAAVRSGDLLTAAGAACFGLHISLLSRFARGENPAPLTLI